MNLRTEVWLICSIVLRGEYFILVTWRSLEFYFLNIALGWILKYNQLMSSYSFKQPSLFISIGIYEWLMHLVLASVCDNILCNLAISFHDLINVLRMSTAVILVQIVSRAWGLIFWLHLTRMISTVAHFSQLVVLLTNLTLESMKVGPDLPINFFPRYSISLPYKGNEFL